MADSSGSFGSGFADALANGLQTANASKLQLIMMSKRIEMEMNARLQEQQQEQQITGATPGQLGALAGLAGRAPSPEEQSALSSAFPNGTVPGHLVAPVFGAIGQQNRAAMFANKPQHVVSKPDNNNLIIGGFQSPMTGEWIGQPQTTLEPSAHQEINKVDMQAGNASNMLSQINQLAQQVLPTAPTGVPLNKLDAYFQQKGMPTDPKLKAFSDLVGGLQAQYQKDATGMAPRSVELMKMESGTFPQLTDDVASATQKANFMQSMVANKASAAHSVYDPTNFLNSPYHFVPGQAQQNQQQATQQPGVPTMSQIDAEIARRQSLKPAKTKSQGQ